MPSSKIPTSISIPYPSPNFNITTQGGKQMIWDTIRKKELILTPEEWVRQNFVRYLTEVLKFPSSLLSLEKEIQVASRKKRCDIVVYKNTSPLMIVECKKNQVSLNIKTLEQILRYNLTLNVPYLVVTNGIDTYAIKRTSSDWEFLKAIPSWKEL